MWLRVDAWTARVCGGYILILFLLITNFIFLEQTSGNASITYGSRGDKESRLSPGHGRTNYSRQWNLGIYRLLLKPHDSGLTDANVSWGK